jgi:hypothetical protein
MIDEPNRWAVTIWLAGSDKRPELSSPADSATMDITPRRCQKFTANPGDRFRWTSTSIQDGTTVGSGEITADRWGLVTIQGALVSKSRNRILIERR